MTYLATMRKLDCMENAKSILWVTAVEILLVASSGGGRFASISFYFATTTIVMTLSFTFHLCS